MDPHPVSSWVKPRDTCYFDGHCGLCRRSTRILQSLDWFGRLAFVDMSQVSAETLPVDPGTAMRGMPMKTIDNRVLVGFPAVRRALVQTPLGALVAWVFYLPGISHLGERIYRHIAANRRRDVVCSVTSTGVGR